jgi:hypothetical protein
MHKYTQSTGALFAHRVGRTFKTLGLKTWIVKGQNNGIDIKVYNDNTLAIACEALNWSPYTRLSEKRKQRIIDNLTKPEFADTTKVLIYTTMKDETVLDDLALHDIIPIKIGYQILPRYFHTYYAMKNQIDGRVIDSRETTNLLITKLSTFTKALRLI